LWRKDGVISLTPPRTPFASRRGEFPMIRAIKFVSIPTRDQDRALAFYTDKLGFRVVTDQPFGAQRWIELRIPGAETGLVLFTPPGQEDRIGGFMNLSFVTDDVQKSYEELSGRGVEFVQPPKTEHWGTSALFKDPDGNTFVLGTK
jgi:catechol 2,3-dioxygenase-like lactoylglutathione lyase family enzyme